MGLIQSGVHFSLRQLTRKSHVQFLSERKNLRQVQTDIFKRLLRQSATTQWGAEHGISANMGYAEFIAKVPVTTWSDWEPWVAREKQHPGALSRDVTRFQPTSGSTHKRKWIPYTKSFLAEIDLATATWIFDLYTQYPALRSGTHYWSLSWLPDELRREMSNNDLSYFPWLKRWFLSQVMAVDDSVQRAASSQLAREMTIRQLIERRDLSLLSVWSPTFLQGLCTDLWDERRVFAAKSSRSTHKILTESKDLAECLARLWPGLALVSCWQTADAAPWAKRVQELFPRVPFQGKGLFATEGVVTIPIEGKTQLAYQSHFYEFEKKNGDIVLAAELLPGDEAQVLLSTGSGPWRYRLGDRVLVEEIAGGCPVLTFLGRDQTVDMVGEKLSFDAARDVLKQLGPQALLMLASPGSANERPSYVVVWEGNPPQDLVQKAEALLCEHHHYLLARELQQLAPVSVHACEASGVFFQRLATQMNWVLGDMKWEALMKLPNAWEASTWKA
ncbi:MAG: GH3 auxin-responsive promoter family protein [Bacteriovoracia bacterium]